MDRYPFPLRRRACTCRAFTLVEIILVVAIIMTLAGLAAARYAGIMGQSKIRLTKIEMGSVKTALGNFEVSTGSFPTTAQGLQALVERPADVAESEWRKFMEVMPRDAWGREFKYVCPGENDRDFDLTSAGRDGRFDTPDDIFNFDAAPPKKAN